MQAYYAILTIMIWMSKVTMKYTGNLSYYFILHFCNLPSGFVVVVADFGSFIGAKFVGRTAQQFPPIINIGWKLWGAL